MPPRQESLLEALAQVVPRDEKEFQDLARMKRFARELEMPFSRDQLPAHFTASALVLDPANDRVCLIFHAKAKGWFQPGGHVEVEDEGAIFRTALREASEETGLRLKPHPRLPGIIHVDIHRAPPGGAAHEHLDVRFALIAENPDALRHDPAEAHGAAWVTPQDIRDLPVYESVRRLLAAFGKALNPRA